MTPATYTANSQLKTINTSESWKGTPVDVKRNFMNHEYPFLPNFSDLWKWQTTGNLQKEEKKNDKWKAPVIKDEAFLTSDKDMIVWLGHATFYIRINSITLITDPVFYSLPFVPRHSEMPVAPEKLTDVDYILLSHNHRDHCDKRSQKLLAKNNPKVKVLTGLKLDNLIYKWTKNKNIQGAGWYQEFNTGNDSIRIYYVPSRHWAKRGMFDANTMLWGGFIIQCGGKTIYFMGDSGYGSHFKEIASLFPSPDYCIMGNGAYTPAWFMSANHIAPEDAVKAFNEMSGKHYIPMHYGTFDQSDEPMGEPLKRIKGLENEIKGKLLTPAIGEVIFIE